MQVRIKNNIIKDKSFDFKFFQTRDLKLELVSIGVSDGDEHCVTQPKKLEPIMDKLFLEHDVNTKITTANSKDTPVKQKKGSLLPVEDFCEKNSITEEEITKVKNLVIDVSKGYLSKLNLTETQCLAFKDQIDKLFESAYT